MSKLLDLGDVEILDVRTVEGHPATTTWPCPVCAIDKHLTEFIDVRARNRSGTPNERWMRICLPCVHQGKEDDGDLRT